MAVGGQMSVRSRGMVMLAEKGGRAKTNDPEGMMAVNLADLYVSVG